MEKLDIDQNHSIYTVAFEQIDKVKPKLKNKIEDFIVHSTELEESNEILINKKLRNFGVLSLMT